MLCIFVSFLHTHRGAIDLPDIPAAATPSSTTSIVRPHHALALEEIRRSIAQHLGPSSIIACACVNRDWHASFVPFVWRTVRMSSDPLLTLPPLHALEQNQLSVRDLTVQNLRRGCYLSLRDFQRLSSLIITGDPPCSNGELIPGKSQTNPASAPLTDPDRFSPWYYWRCLIQGAQSTLRTLAIFPFLQVEAEITVQMLEAIQGCGKLDTLELHVCRIRQQNATLFWNAIAQVKTLSWEGGEGIMPDWRMTTVNPSASTSSSPACFRRPHTPDFVKSGWSITLAK